MGKDEDLFKELEDEAANLSSVPTDKDSARLRSLALELVEVDRKVAKLESDLSDAKLLRKDISMDRLPDLMKEIGQDKIGLPEAKCDLVLEAYYHASISKDWSDEDREASFDYLEELGAGDLVKTVLVMQFGRNEIDRARAIVALIRQAATFMEDAGIGAGEIPAPVIDLSVHWGTLTSFVREQVENGEVLDLTKLGATVGSIVKIKKRKVK